MLRRTIVVAAAAIAPLTIHSGVADTEARQSDPATPGIRLTRLQLSTGVALQVAETGPGDAEPVLFPHGYPDSWFSYTPVLGRLPAHIRAIVPSQRGHGDSERPGCCYRVADFAADAVALLDQLGIRRATIVGHSMGSFVAQRIAMDHPERVTRLVLIGSGITLSTKPLVEFNQVVQSLTDPIAMPFIREFQESTAFVPLQEGFLDGLVKESAKIPARVWRDALAGIMSDDGRGEQSRIQVSTLLIWGEHDGLFSRADQDALQHSIRGSRLVVYEQTSHSPHWERPDRFISDLIEFLKTPAR